MSATWPWVDAFADQMEAKLNANRHKGDRAGWAAMEPRQLLAMLRDEVEELCDALEWKSCGCREANCPHGTGGAPDVIGECADVANFAMMIADVAGGLEPKKTERRRA
ncbi:MAG TPA: hypothetical protein VIV56_07170 [Gemmatimonadales bacterium]